MMNRKIGTILGMAAFVLVLIVGCGSQDVAETEEQEGVEEVRDVEDEEYDYSYEEDEAEAEEAVEDIEEEEEEEETTEEKKSQDYEYAEEYETDIDMETHYLGDYVNINIPTGWSSADQEGMMTIFSPEAIDIESMSGAPTQPMLLVLHSWSQMAAMMPEEMKPQSVDEFFDMIAQGEDIELGGFEDLDISGSDWTRASAYSSSDDVSFTGWLAAAQYESDFVLIMAFSPEDAWDDYEDTFEDILYSTNLD